MRRRTKLNAPAVPSDVLRRPVVSEDIGDGEVATEALADGSVTDSKVNPAYTAARDAVAAAEAAAVETALEAYVQSRGINLFANGFGTLGDNTNFSAFTFDDSEAQISAGSFRYSSAYTGAVGNDELLLVNPNLRYELGFNVRTPNRAAAVTSYFGLRFFDVDGNSISAYHHMYRPGTTTTLAADLNNGDTTVQLTDASGWDKTGTDQFDRTLRVWGYESATGILYAQETYSRVYWTTDMWLVAGDWSGNTVTLNPARFPSGWQGGNIPAGTPVSQGDSGGTYKYMVEGNYDPGDTDWHYLSGQIGGIDYSGQNVGDMFPPGAAYCKFLMLPNYSGTITDWHLEAMTMVPCGLTDEALALLIDSHTTTTPSQYYNDKFPYRRDATSNQQVASLYSMVNAIFTLAPVIATPAVTDKILSHNSVGGRFTVGDILALLSGDLTATAGGVATIAPNAVSLTKMADNAVSESGVLGYDGSGNPAVVAPGTSGQVLTSNGTGSAPSFQDAAAGSLGYGTIYGDHGNTTKNTGLSTTFVRLDQFDNDDGDDGTYVDSSSPDFLALADGTYEVSYEVCGYVNTGSPNILMKLRYDAATYLDGGRCTKKANGTEVRQYVGSTTVVVTGGPKNVDLFIAVDSGTPNFFMVEGHLTARLLPGQ